MNTSTNTTQMSKKMMQAQRIKRASRNAMVNNNVTGGVRYATQLSEITPT